MTDDPTKEPQVIPYADRNPQTIMLTDGVRARKTDTGYVLEILLADGTWETDTRPISPLPDAPTNDDEIVDLLIAYGLCKPRP